MKKMRVVGLAELKDIAGGRAVPPKPCGGKGYDLCGKCDCRNTPIHP